MSKNTVWRWRDGGGTYWPLLSRFAEAIDEPALLEIVPCRGGPRVVLECPACGEERTYPLDSIRSLQKTRGRFQGVVIENGRALWPCKPCLDSDKAHAMRTARRRRIVKKYGRKGLDKHLNMMRSSITRRRMPTGRKGAEAIWKQRIRQIRLVRAAGEFGLCSGCGYLTFAQRSQGYYERPPSRHAICPRRRFGPGRRRSTQEIALSFCLAVAHLIRDVDIGAADLDGGRGLAAWFRLPRQTIYDQINWLLDHLPPPDGPGCKRLLFWAQALRWAKSYRDLQAWAKDYGRPWTYVLRRLAGLSPRIIRTPRT